MYGVMLYGLSFVLVLLYMFVCALCSYVCVMCLRMCVCCRTVYVCDVLCLCVWELTC